MAAPALLFRLVAHSSFVIRHSLRPRAGEHHRNRAKQDFEIEPERPVVNVFKIETDPILELDDLIAAADLPQAAEPRFDTESPAVGQIVEASDFVHGQGPGTHEAHLTAQNVDQLRKLINAE